MSGQQTYTETNRMIRIEAKGNGGTQKRTRGKVDRERKGRDGVF